jgi:Flp pilus assembly pilin Flp
MRMLAYFLVDDAATSSVKYGLIAASISLAIVTVLHGVGPKVRDVIIPAE